MCIALFQDLLTPVFVACSIVRGFNSTASNKHQQILVQGYNLHTDATVGDVRQGRWVLEGMQACCVLCRTGGERGGGGGGGRRGYGTIKR